MADRESVFVHPAGICESTQVGEGTRIWAFAHVLPGARIGRDCNICDGVFIENDVVLGDAVTVKSGVQLWDGMRLGNRVFVGPNATFNDRFGARNGTRRAWRRPSRTGFGRRQCHHPSRRSHRLWAMVGAGAVAVNDMPARAVAAGNPDRVVGYAEQWNAGLPRPIALRAVNSGPA